MWDLPCKYNEFIEISYNQNTCHILDTLSSFFFFYIYKMFSFCQLNIQVCTCICARGQLNSKAYSAKNIHWTPCNPVLPVNLKFNIYLLLCTVGGGGVGWGNRYLSLPGIFSLILLSKFKKFDFSKGGRGDLDPLNPPSPF